MKRTSETIVFFGSGPVAADALELLHQNFNIEAVITKPQPDFHKHPFPVIASAKRLSLKILFAESKAELSNLVTNSGLKSRIAVVIDYGIIISKDVIDFFPLGIINSHFSLLPRWRGADPISFAILSGDKETGVSLMIINEKLDEGDLLSQRSLKLAPEITSADLTDDLIRLSDEMLAETLPKYLTGKIKPYSQEGEPTYSRKLSKRDGLIDLSKPAEVLEREIRAFILWPRSYFRLKDIDVILTKAHVKQGSGKPGQMLQTKKEFGLYTSKDMLMIDRLIPAGKREMPIEAFLAGYN